MINYSDIEIKTRMLYPLYPNFKDRSFAVKQIIGLLVKSNRIIIFLTV